MPWEEVSAEHMRLEFVLLAMEPDVNMTELCNQYHISRKSGYKWLHRYRTHGVIGLRELSRRPHHITKEISGEVVVKILELREEHPFWGPKKIKELLRRAQVHDNELPSITTIARILQRLGMVHRKGRGRKRHYTYHMPLSTPTRPNDVWTVDFKGWWRLGDGSVCEPLTIRDLYSKYILCAKPVRKKDTATIKAIFEDLFSRYGLPLSIRSDNGIPFVSVSAPYGLTQLSAWWRILGIELERIAVGHPEENGSHERLHYDIAREIEANPSFTLEKETQRLETWRRIYNYGRPHEALGMKFPSELYRRSLRRYKFQNNYEYPKEFKLRSVKSNGYISYNNHMVFLSESLQLLSVALYEHDLFVDVWFCDLLLGTFDTISYTMKRV